MYVPKWLLVEVGAKEKQLLVMKEKSLLYGNANDVGAKVKFMLNEAITTGTILCISTHKDIVEGTKKGLEGLIASANQKIWCLLQYKKNSGHLVHRLLRYRLDSPKQKEITLEEEDGSQYTAQVLWADDNGVAGAYQLYEVKKRLMSSRPVEAKWDGGTWLLVLSLSTESIINYVVISCDEFEAYKKRCLGVMILSKSSKKRLITEVKGFRAATLDMKFPLPVREHK